MESGNRKVLLEKFAGEKFTPKCLRRSVCAEVFALKSFSENKLKTKSCAENGNWQSLRAQVSRKTEVITAVCYNGSFYFPKPENTRQKFYLSLQLSSEMSPL